MISILGLIGNGIAFHTFGKMCNRNASTYLFRVLALVDSFVLVMNCAWDNNHLLFTDPLWETVADRFLMRPLFGIAHTDTIWTILLVGVHRYIFVCKPLRAARLCTVGNARRHFLGVLLLSLIVNFPRFFEYEIQEETSHHTDNNVEYEVVETNMNRSEWYRLGYSILFHAVIMNYLIPVGSLTFITVKLLKSLRSSSRRRMELSEGQRQCQTTNTAEWMVIVVLIMFLLCHTGLPMRLVLERFDMLWGHSNTCKSAWFVLYSVAWNMIALNSSTNIIIYVGFNRNFRKTLCLCVRSVTSRQNNQQPATLTTVSTMNDFKESISWWCHVMYSISQKICTRFCCALLCCGYAIIHNEFTWSIYPYSSGLLCWHWGNR